jgi:energy-converting hydrogenase Eha subunit A
MIFEFALMFLIIIIAIGVGYLCMNLNYVIPVAILTVVFTLGSILINNYVKKNKNQLFEKII